MQRLDTNCQDFYSHLKTHEPEILKALATPTMSQRPYESSMPFTCGAVCMQCQTSIGQGALSLLDLISHFAANIVP
jgi:hypothetical protein